MRTFTVTPGSELDRVLDVAADEPVLIERNGARFRISKEPDQDIWAGYDPEAVRRALAETAGSWSDLDADKLIADIYRWREEGSRPADRP
jgi:hypothetical protein